MGRFYGNFKKSREDRKKGHFYSKAQRLEYLLKKIDKKYMYFVVPRRLGFYMFLCDYRAVIIKIRHCQRSVA